MSDLYLMPDSFLDYRNGMHWHFARIGESESSHRLYYVIAIREFRVNRLMRQTIVNGWPSSEPIGRDASVEELVALLPPEELAKAVAASITRN